MPRALVTAFFLLVSSAAFAIPDNRAPLSPGEQCRVAIATAERGHAIPPQLMAAIGRVESGRRDPGTGTWGAWPWTINAEGQGAYFETKAEAINAVQALQARGVRSIDVGCMQVNLMHHPTAFASLDMAFEPGVNTDYAAQFLVQLYGQTGDWVKATAHYHSANPSEGEPYAAKVTSLWPEEQRKAGLSPASILSPTLGLTMTLGAITPMGMVARGSLSPTMAGPAGHGAITSAVSPFPAHPAARLFAMAGMPIGTTPFAGSNPVPGGQVMPQPGVIQPGMALGSLASPGRGLAFYRTVPIRMVMPMRPMLRAYGVLVR